MHLVPAAAISAHHTVGYIQSLRRRSGGFTLVELLVVIAIIGVLATLVLLQLGTARGRARDTQRITQVNQIRTAVEQYYEDNSGSYPDDIYATDTLSAYIARVPKDPLLDTEYGYAVVDDGAGKNISFVIWAGLEQNAAALKSDADIIGPGQTGDVTWVVVNGDAPAGGGTGDDADQCNASPTDPQDVCIYDQGVVQ